MPEVVAQDAAQDAAHNVARPAFHAGRYAPSPSGDLHVGNLRTAVLAWLFARHSNRLFFLRVEDVDTQRSSQESERRQIEDLTALGFTFDGLTEHQSHHDESYDHALADLEKRGLVYPCFCSRKDIREAARAPHSAPGSYPGTCRNLTAEEQEQKRNSFAQQGRFPSLRLKTDTDSFTVRDQLHGDYTGVVDDFILRRGGQDPGWAYNFVVVIDDAMAGIDQVVRGDDLLSSTPRQAYLAKVLGFDIPEYVHVPLVVDEDGERLAKRYGGTTLRDLSVDEAIAWIAGSIGLPGAGSLADMLDSFDPSTVSTAPVVWP